MLAAAAATPSNQAARQELWLSFGSVLQAYLAVALLGSPDSACLVAPTTDTLALVAQRRTLRLTIDKDRAYGSWSLEEQGEPEPAYGWFQLLLDGTLAWSGFAHPQEMDALAITLIERLLA